MKPKKFSFATLAFAAALVLALPAAAGDLEPPGPPGSTMKTLDEIPGSWHRMLDSTNGDVNGCNSDRFKCVMNNDEAVLDLETGLVWERTPRWAGSPGYSVDWDSAVWDCLGASTGGRTGWRLPHVHELLTVFDKSQATNPRLPPGHPFAITAPVGFFSSDTAHSNTPQDAEAIYVSTTGDVFVELKTAGSKGAWCVRGPTSNHANW